MAAFTCEDAKRIWNQIFQSVFSDEMSIKILADRFSHLAHAETTHPELRNGGTSETMSSINYLIDTPGLTWESRQDYVRSLPIIQQALLYDRFSFVDNYLSKVGPREFINAGDAEDFLRWGLIDLWNRLHCDT